ncbi:MAG TPA: hypothetical protein DEO87_00230 [Lachnospiraceae bacterium]|nr:hypothetical protein [Lachnospiraceae bacterium]
MANNQSKNKKQKSNTQQKSGKKFDQKKNTRTNYDQKMKNRKATEKRKNKEHKGLLIGITMMLIGAFFLVTAAILKKSADKNKTGYNTPNGAVNADRDEYNAYNFGMGTSLSVTVYGKMNSETTVSLAEEEAGAIFDAVKYLDNDVITWRYEGSALYGLNYGGVLSPDSKSDELLYDVIRKSLEICNNSEGALDITIRPILNAWQIETYDQPWEDYLPPDDETLLRAKKLTGTDKIKLTDDGITLDGTIIDLGSVGKGYVLDYVANMVLKEFSETKGIKERSIVFSAGGSVLVYGTGNLKRKFKIGIRDPKGTMADMVGYLEFPSDCGKVCVSTSGNYEKYIEKDGVRYHHIIDPSTMKPADNGLASVTVVCGSDSVDPEYAGLISDGLSTACFVLGEEKSRELLKKYNAEAVFIDEYGEISVTDGLKDSFKKNE